MAFGCRTTWGTPEVTLMGEDILPSRRTCCVRLVKNDIYPVEFLW